MSVLVKYLFFLLLSLRLCGQKYASSWYTTDNGLTQNSVKDIIKDKYGYLWLATENSIIRYDGINFQNYNHLPVKNFHFKIFRGSRDRDSLYIGNAYNSDCVLINGRKATVFPSKVPVEDELIINGTMYVYYYKRNMTEPTLKKHYIVRLQNEDYIFSNGNVIFRDNLTKIEKKISIPFRTTEMKNVFMFGKTIFIPDQRSRKIVEITGGIVKTYENHFFTDPKNVIYWEQNNNQVFIIRNDDIYEVEFKDERLSERKILCYPNFANQQFFSMYYDKEYRTFYLGSLTKGLNVLKLHDFTTVKRNVAFEGDFYYSALPFAKDQIISHEGYVFDSDRLVRNIAFEKGNNRNSLVYDDKGNILSFYEKQVRIYEKSSGYQKLTKVPVNFRIIRILKAAGLYFLASERDSRVHLYMDDSFKKIRKSFQLGSIANCMAEYTKDQLLIGSEDGLYLLDLKNYYVKKVRTPEIGVKNICKTKDGNIWVITNANGMFLLKEGNLLPMPRDKDDILLSPHAILEDRKGFLWISSNNGIFRILKKNLLEYAHNTNKQISYYRFARSDGFGSNEFNGGGLPSGNILKNGNFVFPSVDGFVFFTPENVRSYYPDPKQISVERVQIDDEPIKDLKGKVTLENNFHQINFFIDLPYYSRSENLVIQAKTENLSTWSNVGENRIYTINKLSSGDHTIQIRVLVDDEGHYFEKSVPVYVKPLIYEKLWFILCCIVTLVCIIIYLIRMRTLKLKNIVSHQDLELEMVTQDLAKSNEKLVNESSYQEQLFQAITHDIATPIKHLSNLSRMLAETDDAHLQKKYFDSVYKSTEELYKITLNLREYRHAFNNLPILDESYYLYDITQYRIELFSDVASYKHTNIVNNVDKNIILQVNKSAISIILHNVLDNAIKNTENGAIIFTSKVYQEYIMINVSDTGRGMSKQELQYYNKLYLTDNDHHEKPGIGIQMIIKLVKKINAEIEFRSNVTKGTNVIIKLKKICSKEL